MTVTTTLFRPTLTTFGDIVPSVALSVILPCYRAPSLARASATRLINAFAGRIPTYEIIVVDDGIGDCEPVLRDLPTPPGGKVTVITLPENRGKGGAVAAGMKAASGRVRIFTDVDIPYGTTPIMLVESLIRNRGFHIVTGDRTFPQSRYETELSFGRRLASRVFSKITATLVTGGFFDTQCGLKGFRGDIAESLFALQTVERFAFDVELIYLALTYGLEIKRIPVMLESNTTSSVQLGRDAIQTFIDVARIKLHQLRGDYESVELRGLVARECDATSIPLRTPVVAQPALKVGA
jgi:glycosyltransferase involved in cell wall biosynthesis